MTLPRYLLVVPDDGDPHGLLAVGACGARPPMVNRWDTAGLETYLKGHGPWISSGIMLPGHPALLSQALPLVWDGAVVPEGVDRVRRVLAAREGLEEGVGLRWWQAGDGAWCLGNGDQNIAYVGDLILDPEPEYANVFPADIGPDLPGNVPAPVALAQVLVARCGGRVEVSDV